MKSEKAKEGSKAIPKLNFEKEIRKMDIDSVLIHKILSEAVWAKGRQKPNGIYEIRLRRSGYNIQVSSKDLSDAKLKFIIELERIILRKERESNAREAAEREAKKVYFEFFTMTWLEVVKKPNVKQSTYYDYLVQVRRHLLPEFGEKALSEITALDIVRFLNRYSEKGETKTALKLFVSLKAIFAFAVEEGVISRSPMRSLQRPLYEAKNGQALTPEEERLFVARVLESSSPCKYALLFALYTGARRSEIATAVLEENFVRIISAKQRKGKKEKIRKVPITPMLRPYISEMTEEALKVSTDLLSRACSALCPGHHLHELRHTFISRAQECGVSRELVSVWAGHQPDSSMTSLVYTHFSEEYQLKEAQKIRY